MPQEMNVRAVERAMQILNCFVNCKDGLSLAEISRAIGLSPSTTLRIIGTLERGDYLYRDHKNLKYYLGFKLAKIGHAAFTNMDVVQVGHSYLEDMVQKFGESTGIYLRQGKRRVCVDRVDGTRSLRSIVQVGNSAQLTRGASGRVLLAGLDDETIREMIQDEEDASFIMEQIRQTRADGYAISYGEREEGVVSIAAPILNSFGEVVAALFITGPDTRMDRSRLDEMQPQVCGSAREITRLMGYSE